MLIVTDEMVELAARAQKDLKMELAVALYTSEVFSLRKSAEYAGVPWLRLAEEAKKRDIPAWDSITPEDFQRQMANLKDSFK